MHEAAEFRAAERPGVSACVLKYSHPKYSEPTFSEPTYSEPTYSEPTYSQPKHNSIKHKSKVSASSSCTTAAIAAQLIDGAGSGTRLSDPVAVVDETESMEEPEPPRRRPNVSKVPNAKANALGIETLDRQSQKARAEESRWTWPTVAMWVLIVALCFGSMAVDRKLWQQMLMTARNLDPTHPKQPQHRAPSPTHAVPSFHAYAPAPLTRSGCRCVPVTHHLTDDGLLHSWMACGGEGWWCVEQRPSPHGC